MRTHVVRARARPAARVVEVGPDDETVLQGSWQGQGRGVRVGVRVRVEVRVGVRVRVRVGVRVRVSTHCLTPARLG